MITELFKEQIEEAMGYIVSTVSFSVSIEKIKRMLRMNTDMA